MKGQWFLLTCLLFFCGCEHEMEYRGNEVKLKEVKNEQNEVIANYAYNDKGFLKSMWSIPFEEFSKEKLELTYEYDSKDRLSKIRGYVPGNPIMSSMMAFEHHVAYTYEYDLPDGAWSLTTENSFDIEPKQEGWTFKVRYKRINENVIEGTNMNKNQEAEGYRILWFFNEGGNLVELQNWFVNQDGEDQLSFKTLFEYDNGHNPFYNPFILSDQSKNNMIKKTEIGYDSSVPMGVSYTSSYRYEYSYNRKNYPIRRTTTLPNTISKVEYFEYY